MIVFFQSKQMTSSDNFVLSCHIQNLLTSLSLNNKLFQKTEKTVNKISLNVIIFHMYHLFQTSIQICAFILVFIKQQIHLDFYKFFVPIHFYYLIWTKTRYPRKDIKILVENVVLFLILSVVVIFCILLETIVYNCNKFLLCMVLLY